jgi:hypothetical protein
MHPWVSPAPSASFSEGQDPARDLSLLLTKLTGNVVWGLNSKWRPGFIRFLPFPSFAGEQAAAWRPIRRTIRAPSDSVTTPSAGK